MKLRAIRLREAGGFRDGQALEGLSGELDVFAAPNEMGKSTILQGLRALFFMPHSSTDSRENSPLARLKPLGGGAPLIEADFDIDGRSWRLRKQFFSSKQAVLSDIGKGSVVARGSEADQQALQLLQGRPGVDERLALLWVGQQETLQDLQLSGGEAASLRSLIESQIQDVASGGRARDLRQEIAGRFAQMLTATGRPKKNTAYFNALGNEKQLHAELAAARSQADEARQRLTQLHELLQKQKQLSSTDAVKARDDGVAQARKAHDAAEQAREKLRHARLLLEKCLGEQKQATKEHSAFEARLEQLQQLQTQIENAEPVLEELQQKAKSADAARSEMRETIKDHREALQHLQQQLKAATEAQRRGQALQQLDKIKRAIAQARAAETDLRSASEALENNAITSGRVQKLRNLANEIAMAEAQLSARAAKVTIDYEKGAGGRIKIAGEAVADGARFDVDGPMVLEIEGVGRISIAPGGDSEAADLRGDTDAQKEELAATLALMGVADLTAAEAGLEARGVLEARMSGNSAQLDTLAPAGIHILEQEAEELAATIGSEPFDDVASGEASAEELARRIEALQGELLGLEQKFEKLGAEAQYLSTGLTQKITLLEAHQAQVVELAKNLPPMDERPAQRNTLAEAVTSSELAVNAAQTALQDWQEKAGDESSFALLVQRREQAIEVRDMADQELNSFGRDISQLKGALSGSAQDGIETRVNELKGQLASAAANVARFRQDIEALNLLDDVLAEAETATQDRFLMPVTKSIAPYLDLVLPGAELGLTSNFEIADMTRNGGSEPLNILSDGTREQIAVLVRLGFARLLAQSGTAVPLILDDALVYSDDQRIGRAFDAFRAAAKLHQVIILTCRTASFAGLNGHRLELVPWTPRDTEI